MLTQSSEYFAQAARLTRAGQGLLETITDSDLDQPLATSDLEAAAAGPSSAALRLGFAPTVEGTTTVVPVSPDTVLAAMLLDLESANLLMSDGIALNEQGNGANIEFLEQSIAHIESSTESLKTVDTRLRFAPQQAPSKDGAEAIKLFQDSADRALNSISDGAAGVINSAIENLKKLDAAKVLEAIDNLGKPVDLVAAGGRLIRQGIEKLKSVLDVIAKLFGEDALAAIKEQVKSIWEKVEKGEYTKVAVRWIVGTEKAEKRVAEIVKLPGLEIGTLDGVSRQLASLDDNFQTHIAIVKNLLAAVTIASGILAFLHVLGPWLALATGSAYLSLLAAALLIGLSSTGLRPLAQWGAGVCSLIEEAHGDEVSDSK